MGEWDVSHVTGMGRMFSEEKSFNGDLSAWDVSRVTDMVGMFSHAGHFNGGNSVQRRPLQWDVPRVADMYDMFPVYDVVQRRHI